MLQFRTLQIVTILQNDFAMTSLFCHIVLILENKFSFTHAIFQAYNVLHRICRFFYRVNEFRHGLTSAQELPHLTLTSAHYLFMVPKSTILSTLVPNLLVPNIDCPFFIYANATAKKGSSLVSSLSLRKFALNLQIVTRVL